jgi:LITAF-like zinc ribbon domain
MNWLSSISATNNKTTTAMATDQNNYVDIENGALPVLTEEEKRQARLEQQQIDAAAAKQQPEYAEATLIPSPIPHHQHKIVDAQATAPPHSLDVSSPAGAKHHKDVEEASYIPPSPHHGKPTVVRSSPDPKILRNIVIQSRYPVTIDPCPYCGMETRTNVTIGPNVVTWVIVIVLVLVFWPLFWLPLCMDSCKSTKHFCSKCGGEIGEVEPCDGCCVKTRR